MPLYEFICKSCGTNKDEIVPMGTESTICDICGGVADKVMSAPSFILKGCGWAADGYSKSSKTKSSKSKEKS